MNSDQSKEGKVPYMIEFVVGMKAEEVTQSLVCDESAGVDDKGVTIQHTED